MTCITIYGISPTLLLTYRLFAAFCWVINLSSPFLPPLPGCPHQPNDHKDHPRCQQDSSTCTSPRSVGGLVCASLNAFLQPWLYWSISPMYSLMYSFICISSTTHSSLAVWSDLYPRLIWTDSLVGTFSTACPEAVYMVCCCSCPSFWGEPSVYPSC